MTETVAQDLGAAVIRVIQDYVPENAGEISTTDSLEEIGIDSMTLVDIVLELQDEYSVEFPDDALAGIDTVGDMVAVLRGLVTARTPSASADRPS